MLEKIRFVFWGFSFLFITSYVAPLQMGWAIEPPPEALENQLKLSLREAETQLVGLQPWQKKIFNEEVVPQYQRFIRDYQVSGNVPKVTLDLQSLKRYLSFYAPQTFKLQTPTALVVLKTDQNCAKCMENVPAIQKLVESRLLSRGFSVLVASSSELSLSGPSSAVMESISTLMKKKQVPAALVIHWAQTVDDDLDTAHADAKRYVTHAYLQIRDIVLQKHQKEILDSDNFELMESKVITEMFIELGSKFNTPEAILPESGSDEVLVEATGVRDYFQYLRVRNQIVSTLKDVSPFIEDRSFSKNRIVFAVLTKKKNEEVQKILMHLKLDPETDSSVKVGVP